MRKFVALLAMIALSGCATNFESKPLNADHPASAQAQEAPRFGMKRLIVPDELTRKTNAQLARKDVPNPDFQGSGMSHDMSDMKGMDHSKMQGMDMNKPPPKSETMEGMDHSKMKGMAEPAPAASPANKEAVGMEMKKTSDEMKKLSDELKAKSDAEKATAKPSQAAKSEAAYWTCVMHPEIHADKPGQCPKCGMTLVKKEGGAK